MRLLLIVLIVLGVLVVLAVRAASARRRADRSPQDQPQVVGPDPSPAGADGPAERPGGTPIPGSEEDRHRHGKP